MTAMYASIAVVATVFAGWALVEVVFWIREKVERRREVRHYVAIIQAIEAEADDRWVDW